MVNNPPEWEKSSTHPNEDLADIANRFVLFSFQPDDPMIRVWPFGSAPVELRSLSLSGGDEDWLLLAPPGTTWIPWAEDGSRFGAHDVDEFILPSGWIVRISDHA